MVFLGGRNINGMELQIEQSISTQNYEQEEEGEIGSSSEELNIKKTIDFALIANNTLSLLLIVSVN